jgi:ribonuclease VapC
MTARWIVLDTSVFIAIILEEPEAERFLDILEYDIPYIFRPCPVWRPLLSCNGAPSTEQSINWTICSNACLSGSPISRHNTTYSKGSGHKARLNFGDCAAYALAKILEAPLLFKGKHFAETDVMVA